MAQFQIEDRAIFSDPVRMPTPSAESPIGNVLDRVGQQMEQVGSQLYKARQEAAVTAASVDIYKNLQEAHKAALQETDPKKALDKFKVASDEAKGKALEQGFDETTKARIGLIWEHNNVQVGMSVFQDSWAKQNNIYRAELNAQRVEIQDQASRETDPDRLAGLIEQNGRLIENGISAGFVHPVEGGEMLRNDAHNIYSTQAEQDILFDPAGAITKLNDPKNYPTLTGKDRVHMLLSAISQGDQQRRQMEMVIKKQQDEQSKNAWAMLATGELSVKELITNKDLFSREDFTALLKASANEDMINSDRTQYSAMISGIVGGRDMSAEIARISGDGGFTKVDTNRLLDINRQYGGEDRKAQTPFQHFMKLVHDDLGGQSLLTKFDFDLAQRVAGATDAFWDKYHNNQNAPVKEMRDAYKDLVRSYSAGGRQSTVSNNPVPFEYLRDATGKPTTSRIEFNPVQSALALEADKRRLGPKLFAEKQKQLIEQTKLKREYDKMQEDSK